MISMDKEYKTRNGKKVRLLTTDRKGIRSVIGLVENDEGEESLYSWHECGRWGDEGEEIIYDLIEVPKTHKVTGWFNLYLCETENDGYEMIGPYHSKDVAHNNADLGRIACVELSLEVKNGDGLEKTQ
jgi:hypothetical protein